MHAARPQDWEVRTAAYRHLIDTFGAPGTDDLARRLDMPAAEVEASLERLDAAHQIVLAPGGTRIWMLHPFSAIPTEFPVEVEGGTYWELRRDRRERVKQIQFFFLDRTRGSSKLTVRIGLEALWMAWWLRIARILGRL